MTRVTIGVTVNSQIDYSVVGSGNQTLLNLMFGFRSITVYIDGAQRLENNGWQFWNDNVIFVTGAKSNASINYSYSIPPVP